MPPRGRPGPRPNPNAPRSRHKADERPVTYLPPDGCQDDPPPLPPGRAWSEAEEHHWRELWSSPQGDAWEDSAFPAVAALVVATSTILGSGRVSAQLIGEQRALMNDLGLTPASMERMRWIIGEPPQHVRPD
ncbi:phage terminase small subunit [Streptomyces sp. NPDC003668]